MRARVIAFLLCAALSFGALAGCADGVGRVAASPSPAVSPSPAPTPTPTPSPTPTPVYPGVELAEFAAGFVGSKYHWGGAAPETGFDCSGFVYYVYSQFGHTLDRIASDQAKNGVSADPDNLMPGDVLCFYSGKRVTHVGIYLGERQFVHAQSSTTGVVITQLEDFYENRGWEARRIFEPWE